MENPRTFQIFLRVSADVFFRIGAGSYRKMYNKSFVANGAASAVCNRKQEKIQVSQVRNLLTSCPEREWKGSKKGEKGTFVKSVDSFSGLFLSSFQLPFYSSFQSFMASGLYWLIPKSMIPFAELHWPRLIVKSTISANVLKKLKFWTPHRELWAVCKKIG